MYDLAIVGGGPAGISAAVYAARKRLKTVLITDDWGGQSTVSPEIQNWIGDVAISGNELAQKLKTHVESYKGEWLTIVAPHRAKLAKDSEGGIEIATSDGKTHQARTLLVATGSNRRKLTVPGAAEYDQKGLTYCASCDGPMFADQDVAVIGGGNAAFETAMQLLAYCKTVTLIIRGDTFRADEMTVEKVLQNPKIKVIKNTERCHEGVSHRRPGPRYQHPYQHSLPSAQQWRRHHQPRRHSSRLHRQRCRPLR